MWLEHLLRGSFQQFLVPAIQSSPLRPPFVSSTSNTLPLSCLLQLSTLPQMFSPPSHFIVPAFTPSWLLWMIKPSVLTMPGIWHTYHGQEYWYIDLVTVSLSWWVFLLHSHAASFSLYSLSASCVCILHPSGKTSLFFFFLQEPGTLTIPNC